METYGLEKLGILNPSAVYRNLGPAQLTEAALRRGEGKLSNTGALGEDIDKLALASYFAEVTDRKSTRLNSSHRSLSRMPSSA